VTNLEEKNIKILHHTRMKSRMGALNSGILMLMPTFKEE
jgi:hypothetical protein